MISLWQIWVIVALLTIILEVFTNGFAVACFSIGAGFAAIGAAVGCSIVWQAVIFAIFSFLAFIFVRPFVLKTFFKKNTGAVTNADALIGRRGRVTTAIDPASGKGRVAIDGDDWKAVSADGTPIAAGTQVEVVSYESIVITVKPL